MNRQISSENDILKILLWGLSRESISVRIRFCNVILDVCSSFAGQQRLLELSALKTLMVCFLQVSKSLSKTVMVHATENGRSHKIAVRKDELPILVLGVAITLIKSCIIKQLASTTTKHSEPFFNLLLKLWSKVRQQILLPSIFLYKRGDVCLSDLSVKDVAESIYGLSIYCQHQVSLPNQDIERIWFGIHGSTFKNFIIEHWEDSSFLIIKAFQPFVQDDTIGSLWGCVHSQDVIPQFFSSILSERYSSKEDHLFPGKTSSCEDSPYIFSMGDIRKCEEAFNTGHTIAMRGMEFRFKSIAAIAEGLADLFGQPSMGANLHLTPPDCQGLARHYDDHCVFVCQLLGAKEWRNFSPQKALIPRLYERSYETDDKEVGNMSRGCTSIHLKEGDILYVPQGFLHEACTITHSPSLHLAFSIEVEAPFYWKQGSVEEKGNHKLSLLYLGLYEIQDKVRKVDYGLDLPEKFQSHLTFYVLKLRKSLNA